MDSRNDRSNTERHEMITLQVPRSALTALWVLGSLVALLLVAVAFVAGLALRPSIPDSPVAQATIPTGVPPSVPSVTAEPAPLAVPATTLPVPTVVPETTVPAPTIAPAMPTVELIRPTAALLAPEAQAEAPAATPDDVDFRIDPPAARAPGEAAAPVQQAAAQARPAAPGAQAAAPAVVPAARPADAGAPAQPASASRPAPHDLRGSVRWSAAAGPIIIQRDLLVSGGASLIIEPGVEVQMARGVSILVDGSIVALATPDRPVRFVQIGGGDDPRQRWESITGRTGSVIDLRNVFISGGGAGGTVIAIQSGRLSLQSARISGNGGHIRANDSFVIIRDSEISGNRMPYGAAIDIALPRGGGDGPGSDVVIINNRVLNNALVAGVAPLQITNPSFDRPARIEIEQNLLVGAAGPDLALVTNTQLMGNVRCNTLIGGANGLSLRSDAPPNLSPMLNIRDNAIEAHDPPNNPFYREFNIGKGATSDLPLGMANNWWEIANGPYEPATNPEGRGEAAGPNIGFQPWLQARPPCAPRF